jgi:hypothetical protein
MAQETPSYPGKKQANMGTSQPHTIHHHSVTFRKQPMGKGVQSLLFTFVPPDFLDVLCDTATFEMLFADPQRRFNLASGKKAPLHFLQQFAEIQRWRRYTATRGMGRKKKRYVPKHTLAR